jgi:hypothetical protein
VVWSRNLIATSRVISRLVFVYRRNCDAVAEL